MKLAKLSNDAQLLEWLRLSGRKTIGFCEKHPKEWNKSRTERVWNDVTPWATWSVWSSLEYPEIYWIAEEI